MDPLVFAFTVLVPAGIAVVALAVGSHRRRSAGPSWVVAAKRLGLTYQPGGLLDSQRIEGQVDGVRVEVDITADTDTRSRQERTRFVITNPRMPQDIAMGSETFWSALDLMGEEIVIGDDPFDRAIMVRGGESTVLAVLDQKTRGLLLEHVRAGTGHVRNGKVESNCSGHLTDAAEIKNRIRKMVEIAKRLEVLDADKPDRIAQNVADDGTPGVRLRNLEYLSKFYRRTDACLAGARAGADDGWAAVRLLAGRILGQEGMSTLRGLVVDDRLEDGVRVDALGTVADRLPKPDLVTLLRSVLDGRSILVMRVALRVIEKDRIVSLADCVLRLTSHVDTGLAAAATSTLGAVGNTSAQPRLMILLAHESDELKIAACQALAKVGTLDAVEPLLDRTKGMFKSTELKRAARAAVDAIQRRADGADAGHLSVLEGQDDGALSVADDAGAIAIIDDESA